MYSLLYIILNCCRTVQRTSRGYLKSRRYYFILFWQTAAWVTGRPIMVINSLTILLIGVLLLSVFVRSAPIDGKENVFDYQISVGKETGSLFKPGLIIDTNRGFLKRGSTLDPDRVDPDANLRFKPRPRWMILRVNSFCRQSISRSLTQN